MACPRKARRKSQKSARVGEVGLSSVHALDQTQSVPEGHCRKSQTATVTPAKPGDYPFYLRLEEAGRGQYGEPVCSGRQRVGGRGGGARAGDCQALQQDRRTDGGAGFLGQEARSMSAPARRAKVARSGAELSVRRQCALLNVARSGVYRPRPEASADDLALMAPDRRAVSGEAVLRLAQDDVRPQRGRSRGQSQAVQRLMRLMGLEGL